MRKSIKYIEFKLRNTSLEGNLFQDQGKLNAQNVEKAIPFEREQRIAASKIEIVQNENQPILFIKRVLADGNSFYRALAIKFLENIYYYSYSTKENNYKEHQLKRLVFLINSLDSDILIEEANIRNLLSRFLIFLVKFSKEASKNPKFPSLLSDKLEALFNYNEAIDKGMILFMRKLTDDALLSYLHKDIEKTRYDFNRISHICTIRAGITNPLKKERKEEELTIRVLSIFFLMNFKIYSWQKNQHPSPPNYQLRLNDNIMLPTPHSEEFPKITLYYGGEGYALAYLQHSVDFVDPIILQGKTTETKKGEPKEVKKNSEFGTQRPQQTEKISTPKANLLDSGNTSKFKFNFITYFFFLCLLSGMIKISFPTKYKQVQIEIFGFFIDSIQECLPKHFLHKFSLDYIATLARSANITIGVLVIASAIALLIGYRWASLALVFSMGMNTLVLKNPFIMYGGPEILEQTLDYIIFIGSSFLSVYQKSSR